MNKPSPVPNRLTLMLNLRLSILFLLILLSGLLSTLTSGCATQTTDLGKETTVKRIKTLLKSGQHSQAIEELQGLAEDQPDNMWASLILARELRKRGRNDEALETYNRLLKTNPNVADAYYWRGRLRGAKDDKIGAIADLSKSLKLVPTNTAGYLALAEILEVSGRLNEARGELIKAHTKDARSMKAALALARFLDRHHSPQSGPVWEIVLDLAGKRRETAAIRMEAKKNWRKFVFD